MECLLLFLFKLTFVSNVCKILHIFQIYSYFDYDFSPVPILYPLYLSMHQLYVIILSIKTKKIWEITKYPQNIKINKQKNNKTKDAKIKQNKGKKSQKYL